MRSVSFSVSSGVVVGLLAVALGACGGEEAKPPVMPTPAVEPAATPPVEAPAKDEPKPASTMAEMQKAAGAGIGQAMNAHDAKKMASFYTENAVIKMAGMPDVTGRDAIAAMWQKNFDMVSSSKGGASRIFVKGDVVVIEFAWAGTDSGGMGGMKATEKPVGAQGVDIMWFSPDGLVKEQHTYVDMGTIMSQVGASKHKGRAVPTVPTTPPAVVVATGSADEQKNVDAATKMFAAFEKKSSDDFMGGASDDITWDDMTQPETMKGKAAGKKYFAAMTTAFPDVKSTTTNAWGVGDVVIAEGTLSGTQKGAFFGIPATKKPINLHGVDIMQFKDGKIIAGRSYGNGVEMMSQLGLIPQPGAMKDKPAVKTDAKPATPAKK